MSPGPCGPSVNGMDWFNAADYEFARQVLQRGVALMYLIAFASTAAQFRALLGEHGLLPAPELLKHKGALRGPTLFRWHYSDRLLLAVAWTGLVFAAATVIGIPQALPAWVPLIVFLVMWLLYMSIMNIGQTFYGRSCCSSPASSSPSSAPTRCRRRGSSCCSRSGWCSASNSGPA